MSKEQTNAEEKTQEKAEGAVELDMDQLDQVSGGALNAAVKKKTEDITDDVANRF